MVAATRYAWPHAMVTQPIMALLKVTHGALTYPLTGMATGNCRSLLPGPGSVLGGREGGVGGGGEREGEGRRGEEERK